MNICGIYIIKNIITNTVYIGKSININNRLRDHKSSLISNKHKNKYLQRAFNKYGLENFLFEILEECECEKLNEKEIYYIKKFNSLNEGYNMTGGGDGSHNVSFHKNYTIYKFWHPIHGIKECTQIDMKHFLGEFKPGNKISAVIKGKRIHHLGWRLYENKDLKIDRNEIYHFYHDIYGDRICRKRDLRDEFKLRDIGKLTSRQINELKGWKIKEIVYG